MYACRLRRNKSQAPKRATIPMIPRVTATPMPALAPELNPDDDPLEEFVALVADVTEVDVVNPEVVVVPAGFGKM